jgi:hypothetical protein
MRDMPKVVVFASLVILTSWIVKSNFAVVGAGVFAHTSRLLVRVRCGFCRTLPDFAGGKAGFSLFSEFAK